LYKTLRNIKQILLQRIDLENVFRPFFIATILGIIWSLFDLRTLYEHDEVENDTWLKAHWAVKCKLHRKLPSANFWERMIEWDSARGWLTVPRFRVWHRPSTHCSCRVGISTRFYSSVSQYHYIVDVFFANRRILDTFVVDTIETIMNIHSNCYIAYIKL